MLESFWILLIQQLLLVLPLQCVTTHSRLSIPSILIVIATWSTPAAFITGFLLPELSNRDDVCLNHKHQDRK